MFNLRTLFLFSSFLCVYVVDFPFQLSGPIQTIEWKESTPIFTMHPKNSAGKTSYEDYFKFSCVAQEEHNLITDEVVWSDTFPPASEWTATEYSTPEGDILSLSTTALPHVGLMEINFTMFKEDVSFPVYNIDGEFFNISQGGVKFALNIRNV